MAMTRSIKEAENGRIGTLEKSTVACPGSWHLRNLSLRASASPRDHPSLFQLHGYGVRQ